MCVNDIQNINQNANFVQNDDNSQIDEFLPKIREKSFKLYLLDKEYQMLVAKSLQKGITKSQILREFIINSKYENMIEKIIESNTLNKEMINQIQRIGNNINQIAYHFNSNQKSPSDISDLMKEMQNFKTLLKEYEQFIDMNKLGKLFKRKNKKAIK